MTQRIRDGRLFQLTQHFFHALLDLGVLNEEGVNALVRVLLGSLAIILSLGLLLTRIFMGKYAALSMLSPSEGGPALYRQALLADNGLVLGLSMWIVAVIAVLESHSLFPDETDFWLLTPLPITRLMIFISKVLAFAAFAGIFTGTTLLALGPLMLMMAAGRWAGHSVLAQLLAYIGAGGLASIFVVLSVTAVNGLVMVAVPRSRVHGASTMLRGAILSVLVLAVPLVFRLPTVGPLLAGESRWMYMVPSAWFVGLERWLLGERTAYLQQLTNIALLALVAATLAACGSYAMLYARFDRVIMRTFLRSRRTFSLRRLTPPCLSRPPGFIAIFDFSAAALRRSALHQGAVLAMLFCGVALVINDLIGSRVIGSLQDSTQLIPSVLNSVTWAPSAAIFAGTLGVRCSIVVPIKPRANWLFRITEDDEGRRAQLDAVAIIMLWIGVGIPMALVIPLQFAILGSRAIVPLGIAALSGLVLVEIHLRDWRRIPFTCSYLPGKRAAANTVLLGTTAFWLYCGLAGALARSGYASMTRGLLAIALLGFLVAILRKNRRAKWDVIPLMFEDLMPNEIVPLGLPRE